MATFIVAEDEFWQPGIDFAAALRLRGHTCLRLTPASESDLATHKGWRRWATVASRTIPGTVSAQGIPTAAGIEVIDSRRPVDWQASESILNWLSENGFEQRLGFVRSAHLPVQQVQDKLMLTRYLQSAGLAVPATWDDAWQVPTDEPGPFMVKARLLGGGQGIVRCETRQEAVAVAEAEPGEPLIQRFYAATPVIVAGVARGGRFVQAMAYKSILDPKRPFQAAHGLTVVDDAAALAYAADVVAAIGVTGPFALDTVRGDDGRPRALDMNMRIWGSWTACQAAGMDVIGSYLYAVGQGPSPRPMTARPGARAMMLRRPPLDVSTRAERMRWLVADSREVLRRRAWLGPQWARCAWRDAAAWAVRGAALHQQPEADGS